MALAFVIDLLTPEVEKSHNQARGYDPCTPVIEQGEESRPLLPCFFAALDLGDEIFRCSRIIYVARHQGEGEKSQPAHAHPGMYRKPAFL